jgi:hypothetical protein
MGMFIKNIFLIYIILVFFTSCKNELSSDEAREKLGVMNINYSKESLIEAVKQNDELAVKLLLKAGINPNVFSMGDSKEFEKYKVFPVLGIAANNDSYKIFDLLLKYGADINLMSELGNTPLSMSGNSGNAKMFGYILKKGANPNIHIKRINLNLENWGYLHASVLWGKEREEKIKYLIAYGADMSLTYRNIETPLIYAIVWRQFDLVKVLIECGAKILPYNDPAGPMFIASSLMANEIKKSKKVKGVSAGLGIKGMFQTKIDQWDKILQYVIKISGKNKEVFMLKPDPSCFKKN